jgi:predicted nucleic acid-binding protein
VTTYFDSSVVVAALVQEPYSRRARKAISAVASAPFTPLLDLEVRTVFRRMAGTSRMTIPEATAVLSHVDDDLAAGRLWKAPLDLYEVFARAEALSARHTLRTLCRSLDLLHVAAALELGCTRFVTLDTGQSRLAAACGLNVINLRRKAASSRPV